MLRLRVYTVLFFLSCLAITVSGQAGFTGIFNGAGSAISISAKDTLYIGGSLVNANSAEFNIRNAGTIILTDSLVNRAGELFQESTKSASGHVIFAGSKKQIIRGADILFTDVSIRDSVELHSDIHVLGKLKLDLWREPSLLLLGDHTLEMYHMDDDFHSNGGIIEGEDEDHYITSASELGKIRMQKFHTDNSASASVSAFATMGLHIDIQETDDGSTTVERYHTSEPNAALGGIRKYYSITNSGSGFGSLSVRYYDHDLGPEHYDRESLRLFYSRDAGESYRVTGSENTNGTVSTTGSVDTEAGGAFRYTVAALCTLPGLTLGEDRALCSGSSVTVTPQWSSQPAYGFSYTWNDSESINGNTFTVTGITQDTTIWIKAVDTRGCAAYDTVHIMALPVPAAAITPIHNEERLRCISETLTFGTDPLPGYSYRWSFRDGTVASGATVTKEYTVPGTYTVLLTVENEHLCSASDSVSITVEGMPVPGFDVQPVSEKRVLLTDRSQFFSSTRQYEWRVAGQTFTTPSVDVVFPDFGEYPVILTVKGDKCSSTVSRMISITEKGSLDFRIDNSSLCQGTALHFVNESVCLWGSMSYEWDFGDGTRSTQTNPVKTYNGIGTSVYTVTLRAFDRATGWSTSLTRDITVNIPPRINWGGAIATCDSHWLLQPEEHGHGYTYQWNTGAISESIDVTRSGRYLLLLTAANGCSSVESVDITLNAPVVPTIDDVQSCGTVTLDAGNPGSTYLWSTGATTRTLTVEHSGEYSVTVTQPNGCSGSKTVQALIRRLPEVKISGPVSLCEGTTATLSITEEPNTIYQWNTGATASSIVISGDGWYRVAATSTVTSCTAADSLYVTVLAAPVIELGADRNVCLGQETVLVMDDYHYATAVEWWKEGGDIYSGRRFAVIDTGMYNLRVTLANGCSSTDRVHFRGMATPLTVDFLAASHADVGDTLVFIDLSYPDPVSWNWEISSGYTTGSQVFRYAFRNKGVYDVKLSVSNGGCTLSATKTVTVSSSLNDDGGSVEQPAKGGDHTEKTPEKPLYIKQATITEATVMPNPSGGNVQIRARLEHPSQIIARLYTITGHVAASFVIPEQTEDVLYRCDFTGLKSSIYLLQLKTDGDVKTLKIVISKQ